MTTRTLDASNFDDAKAMLGRFDIPDCIAVLSEHSDLTVEQLQAIGEQAEKILFTVIVALMEL